MSLGQTLLPEWDQEAQATLKMLVLVPGAQAEWKPHPKSMSLGQLAGHIANVPSWLVTTFETTDLDFSSLEVPSQREFGSTAENHERFQRESTAARAVLAKATDEEMMTIWTGRNGAKVEFQMPRIVVVRSMILNHLIHHRGQLSVYLRLHDVPLPAIYGPTADTPG